jgi:hypothetical protein
VEYEKDPKTIVLVNDSSTALEKARVSVISNSDDYENESGFLKNIKIKIIEIDRHRFYLKEPH